MKEKNKYTLKTEFKLSREFQNPELWSSSFSKTLRTKDIKTVNGSVFLYIDTVFTYHQYKLFSSWAHV